eukprot:TRINITY_DN96427_c0_g1_i1.p1 TRINITY_DN96427_c0_g1~~TRINITY_DN96427_c0_g1_i1.p1  ORF type:complete len:521 (+),score=108.65 TRINITY_DN96427_c0_g1_i1:59-1564(+)
MAHAAKDKKAKNTRASGARKKTRDASTAGSTAKLKREKKKASAKAVKGKKVAPMKAKKAMKTTTVRISKDSGSRSTGGSKPRVPTSSSPAAVISKRLREQALAESPSVPSTKVSKTKLCTFWQEGKCRKGELCQFAHSAQEQLESCRMVPCRFHTGGIYPATCKYAHSTGELQTRRRRHNIPEDRLLDDEGRALLRGVLEELHQDVTRLRAALEEVNAESSKTDAQSLDLSWTLWSPRQHLPVAIDSLDCKTAELLAAIGNAKDAVEDRDLRVGQAKESHKALLDDAFSLAATLSEIARRDSQPLRDSRREMIDIAQSISKGMSSVRSLQTVASLKSPGPEVTSAVLLEEEAMPEDGKQQKTLICKFWLKGKCLRTEGCTFAHGVEEQKLACSAIRCRFDREGVCQQGADCWFAHGAQERVMPEARRPSARTSSTRIAAPPGLETPLLCDVPPPPGLALPPVPFEISSSGFLSYAPPFPPFTTPPLGEAHPALTAKAGGGS